MFERERRDGEKRERDKRRREKKKKRQRGRLNGRAVGERRRRWF